MSEAEKKWDKDRASFEMQEAIVDGSVSQKPIFRRYPQINPHLMRERVKDLTFRTFTTPRENDEPGDSKSEETRTGNESKD